MEESVWIYISIISVILALAIMLGLFAKGNERLAEQAFDNAFQAFGPHCDQVCSSSPETMASIDVDLPKGASLYTTGQKLCGTFKESTRCAACRCNLSAYTLDLNDSAYDLHTFKCRFSRGENEIRVDCQG
jgi:hypothetical protein